MMIDQIYHRTKRRIKYIVVVFLLKVVNLALNKTTYRRVASLMIITSPKPDSVRQDFPRAVAVARLVNIVSLDPNVRATCLRRTLVAWWLLRWRGIPCDVHIGMNLSSGHAWLEHHGSVINDHPDVAIKFPIVYASELTPETMVKLT